MEHRLASHRILADWWSNTSYDVPIYLGNGPYKIREDSDQAWKNPQELISQVNYGRTLPQIQGNAFFSAKSMYSKNQDIALLLKKEVYNHPALPPSFEPSSSGAAFLPSVKNISLLANTLSLQLEKPLNPSIRYALVQQGDDLSSLHLAPLQKKWVGDESSSTLQLPSGKGTYLALRWVDHYGRLVQTQVVQLTKSSLP
jgi:hypothetical protein